MKTRWKVRRNIIIVTGPPACKKTTTAQQISRWLGCPILCLNFFIDGLQCVDSTILTSKKAKDVISIGVRVLLRQASQQILHLNTNDGNIVLEFPLSSLSQLAELVDLSNDESIDQPMYQFLIIECKPKSEYRWRIHVDHRDRSRMNDDYRGKSSQLPLWFSPKSWDEIEGAIKRGEYDMIPPFNYEDCCVPELVYISNLEIDTLALGIPTVSNSRSTLKQGSKQLHPFYEALEYLLFQRDFILDGPCSLTMQQWQELKCQFIGRHVNSCSFEGFYHDISKYMPQGLGEEGPGKCEICRNDIASDHPTYCCMTCRSFALHKSCAELDWKTNKLFQPIESQTILNRKIRSLGTHSRPKGRRNYKFCPEFVNHGCAGCLLDTRVKDELWPTVIDHPFHLHFLQISLKDGGRDCTTACAACGTHMYDTVLYSCKICNLDFSYLCLDLPLELVSKHIGYEHIMKLKPCSTDEELDNYICHMCWKERDPQLWCYYCEDCDYAAHIPCILSSIKMKHSDMAGDFRSSIQSIIPTISKG